MAEEKPKRTGIFFRPSTMSFVVMWGGEEIGGCDITFIEQYGEYGWRELYKKVGLVEKFMSSPELTIEFLKNTKTSNKPFKLRKI